MGVQRFYEKLTGIHLGKNFTTHKDLKVDKDGNVIKKGDGEDSQNDDDDN